MMKAYTEEQRAALIEFNRAIIAQHEAYAVPEAAWPEYVQLMVSSARVALVALTDEPVGAPPIELPQRYSCEGYHIDEAYLVADEDGDCFDRDEVIEKLRQQGYEVQE